MSIPARYKRLLLVVDTCHAESLLSAATAPHVAALASSRQAEEAVATQTARDLGVYEVDEFTGLLLPLLDALGPDLTVAELVGRPLRQRGVSYSVSSLIVDPCPTRSIATCSDGKPTRRRS